VTYDASNRTIRTLSNLNGPARAISATSWLMRAIFAALALGVCFLTMQTAVAASGTAGQRAASLGFLPGETLRLDVHYSLTLQPKDQDPDDLMLPGQVGDLPLVDDARWSSSLTGNSLAATLWWVVLLFMLFAAGIPWARMAFRESGWASGHARLIALLMSGYLVWILASLELIRFRAVWSALALALVGGAGWILLRRSNRFETRRGSPRSSLLEPEIAFWTVFVLFLVFRWINPDSWHPDWGGEKPMEFTHINAILRSAHFPPYDPWFSDGLLNYYYYGEYLVAYVMKISGIPSDIAFNLAQPTVMALLASGVFSVSSSLASRISRQQTRAWIGGATGVVIVVFMGNLVALRKVLEALPSLPLPSFNDWTWAGSRAIAGGITEFPYFTGLYADLHAHVVALPVTVLIIALGLELALQGDSSVDGSRFRRTRSAIAPFFLATLSLGTLGASNAWDVPLYAALIAASVFMYFQPIKPIPIALAMSGVATAAIFGGAYLLFKPFHDGFVALFSTVGRVRNGTELTESMDHLGGLLALIALGMAVYSIERNGRRDVAWEPGRLSLVLASLAAVAGIAVAWRELETNPISTADFVTATALAFVLVAAFVLARFDQVLLSTLAIASVSALVALAAWRGWEVLAISLAVGAIGGLMWMSNSLPSARFAGLLIAAGGFAAGGVEIIYVVDDLQSLEDWYRMNTLFKVYNEVWIVFGLAASAFAGAVYIRAANGDDAEFDHSGIPGSSIELDNATSDVTGNRGLALAVTAAATIVIAAGLLYPLLATRPSLDLRFAGHPGPSTLNALAWMDYGTIQSASGQTIAFAGDREVIEWFNSEVDGSSVIAEASIGPYRGNGSRISIATGLPTVLGWDRHQRQQRYAPEISVRLADLNELYNSTDPDRKLELLSKYNVEYIIVGEVERRTILAGSNTRPYASAAGLAAFESMIGDSLEIAFQSGETVVYQVVINPV